MRQQIDEKISGDRKKTIMKPSLEQLVLWQPAINHTNWHKLSEPDAQLHLNKTDDQNKHAGLVISMKHSNTPDVFKANSALSIDDHKTSIWTTLTCKHCKGSSFRWGLGIHRFLNTEKWSCAAETPARNLNLSCIASRLQWHHPDQSAWAHHIPWWIDVAGSPVKPQSPEEKKTDSEEAWPGWDTPAVWRDFRGRMLTNDKSVSITSIKVKHADICSHLFPW